MDLHSIVRIMAKKYFVFVMKQDAEQASKIMVDVVDLGPHASLRFLGETANLINQLHHHVADCEECNVRSPEDVKQIIKQMCSDLCKHQHDHNNNYRDLK